MKKDKEKLVTETISNFKKGLTWQRERFKAGKDGMGQNNYDLMCDALENLKSDLRTKIVNHGNEEVIKRIQRIIDWYRTLESRNVRNGPDGPEVRFPPNIHIIINKNLTIAYELLIEQMDQLDLL